MLALSFFAMGCSENDEPDLAGYPQNSIGLFIAGIEAEESAISYEVGYDQDGALEVKSDPDLAMEDLFSRTFEIKAACASPEPMTVKLEPYSLNIPADQVEISSREVTIEPGYNSTTVTVRYTGKDYSFIESVLDARKFELGVRILDVNGYQMASWTPEAKVVADKVAYESLLSMDGAQGREITVNRTYKEGAIVEGPIAYTFQAKLNRPAFKDVVVSFEMMGLDAQFADDVTFSPSKVTIPAGSLVSEEVTCTLTNDFLLTTDWIESHELTIESTFQSEDPYVACSEAESGITIHVAKGVQAFEFIDEKESSWINIDDQNWDVEAKSESRVIDMTEVKSVAGFGLTYTANSWMGGYMAAKKATISISEDGTKWTVIGTSEELPNVSSHYFKLDKIRPLRYVKFEVSQAWSWWIQLESAAIFESKE